MHRGLLLAVSLAVVAALAGCGAGVTSVRVGSESNPIPTSTGAANENAVVPWVDTPGHMFVPVELPGPPPPPTNARGCTAADLKVSQQGGNGGGGQYVQYFAFRNMSSSTCILRGFPKAVATQQGKPDVVGTDGGSFIIYDGTAANMAPGASTRLEIETTVDCSAFPGARGGVPNYTSVVVSIPGGGKVTIHGSFGVICGLFVGHFYVPQPSPQYTQPPLDGASVKLELPSSVKAGATLDYVVALTNPTHKSMALDPCPSYTQDFKPALELNCAAVHALGAHQTVRFAMQEPIPKDTPTGPMRLYWSLDGPLNVFANGTVEVHGHDTPCTAAQLTGSITGPGSVPGPPNLIGEKGLATTVPFRLTNHSATACSVYGAPNLKIYSASGKHLDLDQVDQQDEELTSKPQPAPAVVTLAPRTGSATTNLYWNFGGCIANPNPVTVAVTLPANGATITVKPVGGWSPPPCRPLEPPHGEVGADAFVPAQGAPAL